MDFSTTTLALLQTYHFPIVFLGGVFFGETVIVPAAFLAGEGLLSVTLVSIAAYLGTIISDMAWFYVGPPLFAYAHRFQKISEKSEVVLARIQDIYADRPMRALVVSKFVFGTRILTIIYLSTKKISVFRFLSVNLVSTFLWLVAVVAIGFLAGKSIVNLLPFLSDVKYILLILVILVIGVRLAPGWLTKKLKKE